MQIMYREDAGYGRQHMTDLFNGKMLWDAFQQSLGTVDMQGDLIKDKTELLNTMQIRKEEYLNRQIMRDDIARLTEMYAEQGYVYAEINPQIRKAPTGNRIDLMLDVKQGPVVYVNRIEVQGNTRTRDNVIRRDITAVDRKSVV